MLINTQSKMFTVKFSVAAAGNDNQIKNFQTKNLN